ncbi:hypothetical protein Mapa_015448 [Marchantia paleacea]|nr:hypothetical protein Mapa_015448 [Marchantia paleacea]
MVKLRMSAMGTVNVTACIPRALYHSAYFFKCFCCEPNQPSNTTVTAGFLLTAVPLTGLKEPGVGVCQVCIAFHAPTFERGEAAAAANRAATCVVRSNKGKE